MATEVMERITTNGSAKDGNNSQERQGISVDKEAATAKRKGGRVVNNAELIALDTILEEMESLTKPQRSRVVAYLWGMCQEEMGVTAITAK